MSVLVFCNCRSVFGADGIHSDAFPVSETWSKGGAACTVGS